MLTEEQIIRLYKLLEELNFLFHQEMHFDDKEYLKEFAIKYYPEIRDFYYDIIWNMLPEDFKSRIVDDE